MSQETNKMVKKEISLVLAIVIAFVVGGLGFYGGTYYQKTQATKQRGNFANRTGVGNMRLGQNNLGAQNGARPVSGEITSLDDKSITVKMSDGSSKIVLLADSTVINKSEAGSKADLKQGDKVMTVGTQNSDGSITAQNVQINPNLSR